ncbi:MAG: QueT transporter family protein [Cloacibacillus sp.]
MNEKKYFTPHKIALSALTAALYSGLTFMLAPISFGPMQFRAAEALTLLPYFMPEAIPGLFVGCLISNMIGGFGIIDIVLGSAATLFAAWLSSKMPNLWLAAVPPVVINGIVVGAYIALLSNISVVWTMIYIAGSQAVVCYGLGVPLMIYLRHSAAFQKYLKR